MVELLAKNPVLLLFVTAAIGYALGRLHVRGASLGVAAVLFVGLAIGAQSPDLVIPEFLRTFGLAIFVYTIGLASGSNFFRSFNRQGLRDNALVVAMLLVAAGLVVATAKVFDLKATVAAGFFTGATTNTPALAGVIETVRASGTGDAVAAAAIEPTIGYSIAYPMGVLGPIIAIALVRFLFRIDYRAEAARLTSLNLVQEEISSVTILVDGEVCRDRSVRELQRALRVPIVLSRIQRGEEVLLAEGDLRLRDGDLVQVVGAPHHVEHAVAALGSLDSHHPELDRSRYDFRRIVVSESDVVGRRLKDLRLPEDYDAIVTRVRRGDVDVTATGETVLELGDRVRVVAGREHMKAVTARLGDSYRHLSEIDLLSFGLGMSLGLLLGVIPVPLPGRADLPAGLGGRAARGWAGARRRPPQRAHRVEHPVQRQPHAPADRAHALPRGRRPRLGLHLPHDVRRELGRDAARRGGRHLHADPFGDARHRVPVVQDALRDAHRDGLLDAHAAGRARLRARERR